MDPAPAVGYVLAVDHGPVRDGTAPGATDVVPAQQPSAAAPGGHVDDAVRLLLRLMVVGQERTRQHLNDVLHDGPIQDLTAILLSLAAVRRTLAAPDAEKLTAVENQLRDAIAALHLPPAAFRPGYDARRILDTTLATRVRGPLARELDTSLEVDGPAPTRAELAELLAVVQLLLLESDPLRPARHASVRVRSGRDTVTLTLRATPDSCPASAADAARDAAERTDRLRHVAAIVGAHVSEDGPGGAWRASVTWPRPPSPVTTASLDLSSPG